MEIVNSHLINNNMAQIYTFSNSLLSAAKTGSPNLIGQSLSGNGVNVISLSTNDVGIAFNANTTLTGSLVLTTVQGSVFSIDTSYNQTNTQFALIKNDGSYTIFQYASGGAVGVALSANYTDVSTPDSRRKWVYGYR
jgi:hypothetical protein